MHGHLPRIIVGALFRVSNTLLYGFHVDVVGCGETNNGTILATIQKTRIRVKRTTECHRIASTIDPNLIPIPENYMCTKGDPYTLLEYVSKNKILQ